MKISFDAIGEKYVTFLAGSGAAKGQVCKVSANDTVSGCAAGEAFCGVVADRFGFERSPLGAEP